MKKLLAVIVVFTLLVPIGTLSHEYGHIIAAKLLGYETSLHYNSMNWGGQKKSQLIGLSRTYGNEIQKDLDFPLRDKYQSLSTEVKKDALLIACGGPLQTILTGTIGLFILMFRRRQMVAGKFNLVDWVAIFLAFFWARQIFNPIMTVVMGIVKNRPMFNGGDEVNIARMLSLPNWMISIILGGVGTYICLFVIFKFVPKNIRKEFVIGGIIGSAIGFVTWMKIVGPHLLP